MFTGGAYGTGHISTFTPASMQPCPQYWSVPKPRGTTMPPVRVLPRPPARATVNTHAAGGKGRHSCGRVWRARDDQSHRPASSTHGDGSGMHFVGTRPKAPGDQQRLKHTEGLANLLKLKSTAFADLRIPAPGPKRPAQLADELCMLTCRRPEEVESWVKECQRHWQGTDGPFAVALDANSITHGGVPALWFAIATGGPKVRKLSCCVMARIAG